MKKRQVFKQVAQHLLDQNKRAEYFGRVDEDDCCRYHMDGGIKCAVGCLISDEHYDETLEGRDIEDMRVRKAVELSLGQRITAKDLRLLNDLQILHDYQPVDGWHRMLDEMALLHFNKDLVDLGVKV